MADTDKAVNYEITGDASGFAGAMDKAVSAAAGGSSAIKAQLDTVGKAFEAVQSRLMILAGVVAGGAFFKEAIAASTKLTGEQLNLAKRLGVTGEQASALNTALGDIGSDSDTYISAFDKFAKQLKSNEAGLQAMGLQTRDANGNLRDSSTLFTEALQKVGSYKAGLDQTTAAQTLFGRGVDDVMKLQKLNAGVMEEAQKKNQALGLTLSQEGVAASKAYKLAMNDVSDVLLAVKNVVGQAVMPVFTELGNWLASTGPNMVNIFKGAMTGLLLVFRSVQMGVQAVAVVVFETINQLVDQYALLANALSLLFSKDWAKSGSAFGAMQERYKQGGRNLATALSDGFSETQATFASDMQRVWDPTAVTAPKGGNKTMGDFDKTNGKDKSRMGEWEAKLAEDKLGYQEQQNAQGSFAQFSQAQEADYWRGILALTSAGSQENLAVRRKLADLQLNINKEAFAAEVAGLQTQAAAWKNNTDEKLAILNREAEIVAQRYGTQSKEYEAVQRRIVETKRQASDQILQIEEIAAQRTRAMQQTELTLTEQAAQLDLQLGVINQGQMLAMQQQFEEQRYAIDAAALQDRLALLEQDPDRNPVQLAQMQAQIEQLEQQHQVRMGQIRKQIATESASNITSTLSTIQQSWANLLQKLMQGTITIGGFVKGIFQSIGNAIIQAMAQVVAKWAIQQISMLIFGKTAALSQIGAESAKAGAAGTASMAGAPWPLNMTAPAFGALMASAAMAYAPAAAAAQGFDVPAFESPITQLHPKEMVLPQRIADPLRESIANGGGIGGGDNLTVTIAGQQLAGGFFLAHQSELVAALKKAQRNGLQY